MKNSLEEREMTTETTEGMRWRDGALAPIQKYKLIFDREAA
jgi:hypothetical protein